MAENILKHVITDGTGSKGAAGGTSKSINEDKLASKIGKVYEKVAKDTNASLQKNISKEFDKVLNGVIREVIRGQSGGAKSGGGVSDQELRRLIKDATKTITAEAGNALLKELQKIKPGQAGNSRELETLFKSLDRKIEGLAPAINTALSRAGVEINPQGLKIIANAISGSLRGVVSKEFGTAMRDLNRTVESLMRGLDAAVTAFESLSKIKKSGGGIDVRESAQAIKEIGTFAKEFKNVSGDFKALSQSVKTLAKDQKAIMKDVANTIAEMKKSIGEKARSITKVPPVVLDAENWENAATDFLNRYDKISKSINVGGGRSSATTPIAKEVKQLETTVKTVGKDVQQLNKTIDKVAKAKSTTTAVATTKSDTSLAKEIKNSLKEIVNLISKIQKENSAELSKLTKEIDKPEVSDKAIAKFTAVTNELSKLSDALESKDPTRIKEAAGRGVAVGDAKKLNELRGLINDVQKKIDKSPQEADKVIMEGLKEASKSLNKAADVFEKATSQPPKQVPIQQTGQQSKEISALITKIDRANSAIRAPKSINVYPEIALPAVKGGLDLKFEGSYGKGQENQKKLIEARIKDLTSSLVDLQDYIVTTVNKEFTDAGKRWSIVKDGTEKGIQDFFKLVEGGNVKESGKQFAFDIANVEAIRKQLFIKGRGSATKGTPASMIRELTDVLATEAAAKSPDNLVEKLAQWLKGVSVAQIEQIKEIKDFQKDFINIKKIDLKGILPSKELISKLESTLKKESEASIEAIFKATVGRTEAGKTLKEQKLVRTVSLPAARLTKTGSPVFETARGSKRGLQRFAKFETGFEKIYKDLAEKQALVYSKGYADEIKKVGVKPTGLKLQAAEELSNEILRDFGKAAGNLDKLRESVIKAARFKALSLAPVGVTAPGEPERKNIGGQKLVDTAVAELSKQADVLSKTIDANEIRKSVDDLLTNMNKAGLSMYDVVKAMDEIKFLNVYDILKEVLEGNVKSGLQPLKGLGEKPQFDKSVREYEKAIQDVVQSLPIIEPGRPRRGFQQENVVNVLTRSSDVYSDEKRLKPEEQKDFIKELNVRFNELIKESSVKDRETGGSLRPGIINEGVRTISTLGIPDALASKTDFYRPGQGDPTKKFLTSLDAVSTKMYTDILPEMAPFGAQFTHLGRNISGITGAMSSSKKELDDLAKGFKATAQEGFGTEFPGLRTKRESELISSGRVGAKGYGFNVVTELRHTAGTLEDQVLISGNLAHALTSITKTLVRPAPGGRITGSPESAVGVSELQRGPIKDKDISNVLDKIQEVLGVPEQYKGRADQAFIDEVKRAVTVLRGEEVEVQQAKLTEIFLNAFGRKVSSRYGSRGVGVTPGGLDESVSNDILKALRDFPDAKVKVLSKEERAGAGLGVAVQPRSIGELLSNIIYKNENALKIPEDDIKKLRASLVESGNKFVLGIFKDADKAIVVPEEAKKERELFGKASKVFTALTGDKLSPDEGAIKQIRDLFLKEIPKGSLYKEKPIDIRISSRGIGKRGLQPEVLESVLGNITSVGKTGFTTLPTKFDKPVYEKLLGTGGGKPGELSKISKSLGFQTVGSQEEIEGIAEQLSIAKGKKDPDTIAMIKERAAAIESASNYYSTVIDEFGKARKGLVGEKFISIIEETGETAPWSKSDIQRGTKGASVDIPVFSAYSTVFGEESALIDEITKSTNINQKKQIEFLKALQFMADETGTLQQRQIDILGTTTLAELKYFDQTTGILSEKAGELDPRNLKDTVFDIKKFPKPFFLDIPKGGAEPGETEPMYVPGALARGTYAEELIGGERGVENIGRRLQHVVNMAIKANELLDRPATIDAEIEKLQMELEDLLSKGDAGASAVQTKLLSRQSAKARILSGDSELSSTVKREVTDKIAEFLKGAQNFRFDKSPEATTEVKKIYDVITNALSTSKAPDAAFQVKQGVSLPSGASELQNVEAFLERQKGKKGKTETAAYADAIGKAADLIIGKGPSAQDAYNIVLQGIAEIQKGELENIGNYKAVLEKDYTFKSKVNDDPDNILNLLKEKQSLAKQEIEATEAKMYRLADDLSSGKGLELAAKLGIDIDRELQFKYEKALDKLQKAKIEYFHSLATAAVGKEGAVGTAIFSRKFPAVMKKAVTAVVDRTKEFSNFQDELNKIKGSLPEDASSKLSGVIKNTEVFAREHGTKLAKQRKGGFPILKQHELGIPGITAQKLPVNFVKEYDFSKEYVEKAATAGQEVESNLFDLLKYIENLNMLVNNTAKEVTPKKGDPFVKVGKLKFENLGDALEAKESAKGELDQTSPFVEGFRYPFTGVSSIVPYKAKLLSGKEDVNARNAFVVPGAPEFSIDKLNEIVAPVEEIIKGLQEQRNELYRQADIKNQPLDDAGKSEVVRLTKLMSDLSKALSDVTPKYAAHTAKLDFDGDALGVHTARTLDARKEIEKHYKTVAEYDDSLQSVYRSFFTADALKSEQPHGTAVLAEMAEAFYGKGFEKAKGFDFLVKPFLTGQQSAGEKSPTLEYATPSEQLSILGLSDKGGISKAIDNVIKEGIVGENKEGLNRDVLSKALEAITSPFKDVEEEMLAVAKEGGLEKRLTFADSIYKEIENLDKRLGTSFVDEIQNAVESKVFESKYKDAVEANLFKIHTGIQTESLYRLSRLAESNVGFGGGIAGVNKGTFDFSKGFKDRNPNLEILTGVGGDTGDIARDFYTKFNETFRFALQKGLDVKHAGGKTVSGEIESKLSRGTPGAEQLYASVTDKTDKTFGELQDLDEIINKQSRKRLGELPTSTIKDQLATLYEARGEEYSPAELSRADRDALIELGVKATGLESFFKEMATQIKEGAIEGIKKHLGTLSPEKRSSIGDADAYARGLVGEELSKGSINVREHITSPNIPLYSFRQNLGGLGVQKKQYKEKYGEVGVPDNVKFLRESAADKEKLLDRYKEAKATAKNLQDAIDDAVSSGDKGAFGGLVRSTLDNINREQEDIERQFINLKDQGFDISKVDRSLKKLAERTSTMEDVPDITKKILADNPKAAARELERLADLVGVPSVTSEEKLDLSDSLFKGFRKEEQIRSSKTPDISVDEINKRAEEYAKKQVERAAIIYEMDRILDVLSTRAQEGIELTSLFPSTSGVTSKGKTTLDKSYKFAQEMKSVADQGVYMREQLKGAYGPGKGGTIGGGGGIGGAGIGSLYTGGIVPVHIESISKNAGIFLSPGGGGPETPRTPTEPVPAGFKAQAATLEKLDEMRAKTDQHDAVSFENRIQTRLKEDFKDVESGFDRHKDFFDDPKFKKIQEKVFPGEEVGSYKDLKRKFFTTTLETFSGSKFKGGGEDAIALEQGRRKESQLEGITKLILKVDEGDLQTGVRKKLDPATQAAFDIGTALHAKLQRKIKNEMEAAGKAVEIEKFVFLKPQDLVRGIKGPITGFIDVAYKNAAGEIEKISDIKTTGETFAKFKTISDAIGSEGTIELGELLNKDIPIFLRQKLEEYRTQLNVYLGALKQQSEDLSIPEKDRPKLAEGLTASIDFIPSEDTELKTPPKTVTFAFDPKRLQQDLETLHEARMIVKDYVHNLDTELKDVPEQYRGLVESLRNSVSGKTPAASSSRTLESYQLEQELDKEFPIPEQSDKFINDFVDLANKAFRFQQGKESVYKVEDAQFMKNKPDYEGSIKDQRVKIDKAGLSKQKVKGFPEQLKSQFEALQVLQEASLSNLYEVSKFDFNTVLETMHDDVKAVLAKGKEPPKGGEFNALVTQLEQGDYISFRESIEAYRLWRVAMSDWLIAKAREAEKEFDVANAKGPATREFSAFKSRVQGVVNFVDKSIGKRSDIYTKDRRFLAPDAAKDAGVLLSPREVYEKSAQPFGDDEYTKGIYKDLVDRLQGGTLGAPADEIRKIVDQLGNLDEEAQQVLESVDLFERMGKKATNALDFDKVAKRARVLKEALLQYSKLNLSQDSEVDVEQQFQVRSLLGYLKQIEQVYGRINLERLQKGPFDEYETGAVKVPAFLPPAQQGALHRRNIQKFRDFAERPAAGDEEGRNKGPAVGESFSYFSKVTDQAGNVLKNVRTDFKKYGEAVDDAGNTVGKFSETQTDLIDKMQMSGGTFRSATRRVIMWGAAATLVYGGVAALKDSIGELADIEMGIAQLRMVMNPLETDFASLEKSAVGFAKNYGVSVKNVIASMKIFAQQGLSQQEVMDRTRVSTLAANVTTLSAADATEALTATMKVFGGEVGSADMALDAWSETEARHAITAGDMANAIKKAASAAKNAGFTFNELNGIVAGIGAVTRQTGKEVGTAMRFIARRLFSEKGPKTLADIGIPSVTGEGENRRGFDVLSDLSMKWAELTNAQKLNIAQSLGGTRQYNSLLVAMDNWDEVLEAIEDSTNSKGSAERRNVEIMKTYAKQLEQTKAAATELKLELGKFVFPVFKTGLKALKLMFEFMSDIPGPVKAAGVALGLFFTYASKGLDIFKGIEETFSRGQSVIGNFVDSVKKEFKIANFEIFGEGFGDQLKGLKTFAKGAPEGLKLDEGYGKGLDNLHSGFGKLVFSIKSAGDAYNSFLAAAGKGVEGAGGGIENFGKKFKNTAKVIDYSTDVFQLLGLSTGPFISAGTQIVESLAEGTGYAIEKSGKLFGKSGQKVAEFLSDADPGLFKSIAPLAITLGTMGLALRGVAGSLDRSRKSAQEYAQSVYNARRVEEDQIKELTHSTRQYDRLQKRLEKISKLMTTPGLREQQQDSGSYKAPLLALSDVQGDASKLGNELAQINNKLVIGYDEQGDAILRLTGSYKSYIESLQRASSLELAKTDIDVLKKFTESLTDTGFGESIKRVLKTALGEVPGLGGVLKNLINVSPGKEVQVLTGELNDLLALREKFPLTDAFDQDIGKLQEALGKVKTIYDETADDFKRTLAGIFKFEGAQNIDRDTIASLLSDPGLTKGFELLLELDPKITTVNRARLADNVGKVKTEDIVGSEILKRIFPQKKAFIDYTGELTAAQVESAGIIAREGKKVASGDIVTFFPELAKQYNIAGAQAVVELKKDADGVFEAFATYINSKTLEVEQRELDDSNLLKMVNNIFPSGRIQTELENRLDSLNTFVAGAASGLVGIEAKKFKKDFDLGARFYSEVPTTTALQADKGFNIQSGQFGDLPKLQQEWSRMTKDFFIEPMAKYNREVESLAKNTLDGLDDAAQLSRQKADELYDQQAILRNNQVVVQFAAVFADLSKSMEESSRALQENLAVEKARQTAVKVTSGLLRGVPEGFDAIDTGIRKIQDLSVKQLAAIASPQYRQLAGNVRTQQVNRDTSIGQLDALQKARVAIETITATQGGLGSIIGPEAGPKAVEGFIQKATVLQDVGMATLSQDINNLEGTSSKGFGDVVDRLETMISNQGDLTGFEDVVSSFESNAANKKTGIFFADKLADQLHKTSKARTRAENRGDSESVAVFTSQINRLVDVMVSEQGLSGGQSRLKGSLYSAGGLSQAEFQQRSFRSLQPSELFERFKTEGKTDKSVFATLKPFQSREQFRRSVSGESFADTDEYKKLVSLQEQANKIREKSLLDSKTILKGSVAISTFEAFNKQHSSKVLDTLKQQLSTEETNLSNAGPGSNIREMQKKIEGLNKAISDQEKNLQFHGLIASMTQITGGVTALSKVLGVSETNLKRVNVGAVGLYLAMQAASKVTGKDMPESAKEFGGVLKEAIGELKSGKNPDRSTLKKLRDSGAKFEDAYGERVKEATGKTKEAINNQIKTRLKGMKDLSESEIQERAKQLRKEASGEGGAGTGAIIAALSAATLVGTIYETSGRGTQNAELERLASQTSEVFNDIINKNGKAAEIIANELVKQVKEKVKDTSPALDVEPQNQLLDVAEQSRKALAQLDAQSIEASKAIEMASKSISEFTTEMYKFEVITSLNKSLSDFVNSLQNTFIELESQRKYGGVSILNAGLAGSPGEVELPLQTRQMSTQQRLFSTMGKDFQGSVVDYGQGLQAVNALVSRHADLIKRRKEFTQNNEDDFKVWQTLEKEIKATENSIETATDSLRPFGDGLSQISRYSEAINKLNDSFNDVAAKQAVENLSGFKRYRDNMDKLLGGSHPEAVIGITPEQERTGRGVGVQLRTGVSNKYDLERVQLLDQLKRSSGEETERISKRLYDLPEARRRDIESYRQRQEQPKLQEQLAPFSQALIDIQQIRQKGGLTDEVDNALVEYQDSILVMLERASEKVSRAELAKEVIEAGKKPIFGIFGKAKLSEKQVNAELNRLAESGPKQFRGTLLTETAEIDDKNKAVFEELKKQLPDADKDNLRVAIADPIVMELERQTEILKTLASEGLGVDKDVFGKFDKSSTEKLFNPPQRKGAFGRAGDWIGETYRESIEAITPSTPKFITDLKEKLFGFAEGGKIFGEGGPKEDKVPAMLSPGEYVIRQAAASKLGYANLEGMNKYGKLPTFADGGSMSFAESLGRGAKQTFDFFRDSVGMTRDVLTGKQDVLGTPADFYDEALGISDKIGTVGDILTGKHDVLGTALSYYNEALGVTNKIKSVGQFGKTVGQFGQDVLSGEHDVLGTATGFYDRALGISDKIKSVGQFGQDVAGTAKDVVSDPIGALKTALSSYDQLFGVSSKVNKVSTLSSELVKFFKDASEHVTDPHKRAKFMYEQVVKPSKNELQRLQDFFLDRDYVRDFGKGFGSDYLAEYRGTAKEPDKIFGKLLNVLGDFTPSAIQGKAEGILSFLSGGAGTILGGLAGLGSLPLGLDKAGKNQKFITDLFTYKPKTNKASRTIDLLSSPFTLLGSLGTSAGDRVMDVTGSSTLGAATATGIQALPMVIPFAKGIAKSTTRVIKHGAPAMLDAYQTTGKPRITPGYLDIRKQTLLRQLETLETSRPTSRSKNTLKWIEDELQWMRDRQGKRPPPKALPVKLAALGAESVRQGAKNKEKLQSSGFAEGGKIFGEGGPKEDKVPAMLSPGEYVIRQAAASKLGLSDLEYINKYGEMPKFADGGPAYFKEKYGAPIGSLSFSRLEKEDREKFEEATTQYLDKNPLMKHAVAKGLINVTSLPSAIMSGGVESAGAADYDYTTGTITINEDAYKGAKVNPGDFEELLGKNSSYLNLLAHEFGHAQDSLIRGAIDTALIDQNANYNQLPGFAKDMLKSMTKLSDVKNSLTEYATKSFGGDGRNTLGGVENIAEAEAMTELGVRWNDEKLNSVIDEYNNAFSAENQEKFVNFFGSYIKKRHDLNSYLIDNTVPEFGMGGMMKRKRYAAGGSARKFTTINGQLVEVDEAGNTIKKFGDEVGGSLGNSFLKNKAYRMGVGEVDIDLPKSKPESKALFAEEVASMTGRRMGEEATALHRAKQKLSDKEIMAAEIAAVNREAKRQKEQDPAVRDALRLPGLSGDTGELGLSNLTFDKRRGLVGDESIDKKFQSYHDLREIEFQDMKRGDRADIGMIGQLEAIARGQYATAGQDPANKAALDKEAMQRKALNARKFDIKPGDKLFREAGLHYGRETELLLPIYHKLKAIVEQDKSTDASILRQYDQAASLLGKDSIKDPADMAILGQLVKSNKEGAFRGATSTPVIQSDILKKAIASAKTQQDRIKIQQFMELMDTDPKKAAELAKKMAPEFKAAVESAGNKASNKNKDDLSIFSKAINFIRSPFQPGGAGYIKKADGGSIPFYQSGGIIPQSGPIFAHKGELITPKGFAEGGFVENSSATAALKEGTIKLEDNGLADKIADKIKEAIESSEVRIDEDAVVKVDVTGISIPVDVGDAMVRVDTTNAMVGVDSGQTTIPVDIGSAADAIGDAIRRALDSATVDVNVNQSGGSAVGADRMDELSRTVTAIDDRLLTVRDELTTKIESVRIETANSIQSGIATQVNAAMTRVQQDINEHGNTLSLVNGKITRFGHQMDHKIREVDRIAKDAQNLAQRPPSYVPSF